MEFLEVQQFLGSLGGGGTRAQDPCTEWVGTISRGIGGTPLALSTSHFLDESCPEVNICIPSSVPKDCPLQGLFLLEGDLC